MSSKQAIKRLTLLAEALGYKVIFRRSKHMAADDIGLTCPDLNKIYIDPRSSFDKLSTLAHEIGHVLLMSCSPPGHRLDGDTNFDLLVAENAADAIGAVLCRTVGFGNDFDNLPIKAARSLEEARNKYPNPAEYSAFLFGYCVALADTLPSSEVGLNEVMRKADDVFSGRTRYYRSHLRKTRRGDIYGSQI